MYAYVLRAYRDFESAYILPLAALIRLYYYHWGQIPYFLLFTVVKFALWACQWIWWRLNGVRDELRRTYDDPSYYERSARIWTVAATCKPTPFDKARPEWHYMTLHSGFTHPRAVLADDVMLLDVNYWSAFFVQFPKTVDHYTVETTPFLFIASVTDAVRLIEMPLRSFHRLADELGDPCDRYDRVTFLFNIGRSGSTVIARMIERADPDCLVLSEPPVLFELITYSRYAPKSFFEPAMKSAVRLLLKPYLGRRRLLIKPTYFVTNLAGCIRKAAPSLRFYFCDRDPLKTVWAQERAFGISPLYRLLQFSLYNGVWFYTTAYSGLYRHPPFEHGLISYLKPTLFETCVMSWAYTYVHYLQLAGKFEFPIIRYDSLFENPTRFCSDVLKLFDLTVERLGAVLNILSEDAQENTILGQRTLRRITVTPYDPQIRQRVDNFCRYLNLPLLRWSNYEGTASTVYSDRTISDKTERFVASTPEGMIKPLPMQCVLSAGN